MRIIKRYIIQGDHEQVSNNAVGIEFEVMNQKYRSEKGCIFS